MAAKNSLAWRMFTRSVLAFVGYLSAAAPALAAGVGSGPGVEIRVEGEGWGSAARDEIESVLHSAAEQLLGASSMVLDQPIVVTHAAGSPVTLFGSGHAGEYRVRLSATDRGWAQYAYQFGHELCHVLANAKVRADSPERIENQWFEEAVCEAAGLFVLRGMAVRWANHPPLAAWKDYAPSLQRYADRLLAEPHRNLPAGVSSQAWLNGRLAKLVRNPYLREDNEVVANLLLPLFEQEPGRWAVLQYLNRAPARAGGGVADYLRQWRNESPREHQPFIERLAQVLGLGGGSVAASGAVPVAAGLN